MTDTLSDRLRLEDDEIHKGLCVSEEDVKEKLQEVVDVINLHQSKCKNNKKECLEAIKMSLITIMGSKLMGEKD